MIEHSVFALPFAYIAALTAMWLQTRSVHWVQLLLITIAMVSARTVAMSANRILDRSFDALNPRTARRELVTGELSVRSASVGYGRGAGRLPRLGCRAVVAVPRARACRGVPARPLLLRKALHRLPAGAAGAGPVRRSRRRLDRGRPATRRGRRAASASRSGLGSAGSTSSTRARTPRSTGGSVRVRSRPGSASPAALRASAVVHVVTFAGVRVVRRWPPACTGCGGSASR